MKTTPRIIKALTLGLLLLVAFASCDDLLGDLGLSIGTDYYEFELTVNPSEAGEYVFNENVFPENMDSILTANGQSLESLKSITISDAYVIITEKSKVTDFNAFTSLAALASTNNGVDSIAWVNEISDGLTSLDFSVSAKDMTTYIENEELNLKVVGLLDEELTDTLVIKGRIKYNLNVGF